jgi:hypothetical protein
MREIVGPDRPRILASTAFLIASRSAARRTALVRRAASSETGCARGRVGIADNPNSYSMEIISLFSFTRKKLRAQRRMA